MNKERLWEALGKVEDCFIEEAMPGKGQTLKHRVLRWCACAAGLFLVVGLALPRILPSDYDTAGENTGMTTSDTNTSAQDANGQEYFNGKVLEVYEDYVRVECLDVTTGAIIEGTQLDVTKHVFSKNPVPEMKVGDVIRVVFAGVKETYPPGLQTVFAIYLLDSDGNVVTERTMEESLETSEDEGFPDWGISLAVKDVTPSGLTLVCTQSGGNPSGELQTGTEYNLIVLEDGTWKEVSEIIDNVGWNAIAYLIPKENSTEFEISWEWLYGKLSAGTYRLTKGFTDFRESGDYDTAVYWIEFEIEE